jgi:hypothetical protein
MQHLVELPPLQGEGWGGDGLVPARHHPIPLPTSPLKGEEINSSVTAVIVTKYLGLSYSRGQTLTATKGILTGMKGIPGTNQGLYVKDNADQSFYFCHGPTRTNADKINFLEADPEKVNASRPPLSVWVRG